MRGRLDVVRALRMTSVVLTVGLFAACTSSKPRQLTDQTSGPGEVVEIQSALLVRGFPPGPVDGVVGEKTRAAIAAYQRSYGLEATGYIDRPLKRSLLRHSGALSMVAGSGVHNLRPLSPPFPGELGAFLRRRYGPVASARPFAAPAWLDVVQASLAAQPGRGEAVIVTAWSAGDRQTSQLSIFRRVAGGYTEILGPVENRGFEFPGSLTQGFRDIAVDAGRGYRLWRFDGEGYR